MAGTVRCCHSNRYGVRMDHEPEPRFRTCWSRRAPTIDLQTRAVYDVAYAIKNQDFRKILRMIAQRTPIFWLAFLLTGLCSSEQAAKAALKPGQPVTAVWSNETHLDLFSTNGVGEVVSTYWDGGCGWQPWFPIHPEVKMQPGATVSALWTDDRAHLDLFVTGTDGAVWSISWEAQRGWQKMVSHSSRDQDAAWRDGLSVVDSRPNAS